MDTKRRTHFEAVGVEGIFGRRLLGLLAVAVGAASIVGVGIFIRYLWQASEARDNARQGAELVAKKQFEKAIPLLRDAWQAAPKDPDVLRNLATAFAAIGGDPGAVAGFWQQVSDSGQATVDDRVSLAASMVKISDFKGAGHILESIPDPQRHQIKCVEIEAALLRVEGQEEAANRLLHRVWENSPDDAVSQLKLAEADIHSAFAPIRQKAEQSLWEVARSHEALAAEALLVLLTVEDLDVHLVPKAREIVASHPGMPATDRLAVLGTCLAKMPYLAAEIEDEEAMRFASKPLKDSTEFYEWLSKLGAAPRILKDLSLPLTPTNGEATLKPRPEVLPSRGLYLAYANALTIESKWRDLSSLLETPKSPVNAIEMEVMQALCANGLGKSSVVVDSHLEAALSSARTSQNLRAVASVAEVCERMGRNSMALEAYTVVASDPGRRLEVLQHIYRLQEQLHDADGMLRTAESIHSLNSSLTAYADDVVYLRLITGQGMESACRELMSETAKPAKVDTPIRHLAQALAFHLCGQDDEASRHLSGLDAWTLPAGARAVMAGLLAESGKPTDAFSIAEKISPDLILPEEDWYRQLANR